MNFKILKVISFLRAIAHNLKFQTLIIIVIWCLNFFEIGINLSFIILYFWLSK